MTRPALRTSSRAFRPRTLPVHPPESGRLFYKRAEKVSREKRNSTTKYLGSGCPNCLHIVYAPFMLTRDALLIWAPCSSLLGERLSRDVRNAGFIHGIVEACQIFVDEIVQCGHGLRQLLRGVGDLLLLGFGRRGGVAVEFRHKAADALRDWRRSVVERAAGAAEAAFGNEFAAKVVDFLLERFGLLHDVCRNLGRVRLFPGSYRVIEGFLQAGHQLLAFIGSLVHAIQLHDSVVARGKVGVRNADTRVLFEMGGLRLRIIAE